jgi:hypothetical protein
LFGFLARPIFLGAQTSHQEFRPPSSLNIEPALPTLRWLENPACSFSDNKLPTVTHSQPSANCVQWYANVTAGGENSIVADEGNSSSSRPNRFSESYFRPASAFVAQSNKSDNNSIEWRGLIADSTRFLLFQHAFRLATESDTRGGLSGPFFRDYKDSVMNIHGWHDGDPFFVNYIDHPMDGSVAGFLEVAHDPRYRNVEIGKSSAYWKSRLRATVFSAAFSLQFEIGPVSEASIGNIQKVNTKTGVVDWVITPVVGLGWMIGEDALDKYLVRPLEARTDSHVKRILLRGIFNPTRSFANIMQGKVPWHREDRPGVRGF